MNAFFSDTNDDDNNNYCHYYYYHYYHYYNMINIHNCVFWTSSPLGPLFSQSCHYGQILIIINLAKMTQQSCCFEIEFVIVNPFTTSLFCCIRFSNSSVFFFFLKILA